VFSSKNSGGSEKKTLISTIQKLYVPSDWGRRLFGAAWVVSGEIGRRGISGDFVLNLVRNRRRMIFV
jgi:hypothetical protein